jgi:hypothetical protein
MFSVLSLGFIIGLRHTLEADHICAIAALTTRTGSVRRAVPIGLLWGFGHTLALGAFGMVAIMMKAEVPENLSSFLELAVGLMLIALGTEVLFRLHRERIHFHTHSHEEGTLHFHAHSHPRASSFDGKDRKYYDKNVSISHQHQHPRGLKLRAFLIGIMHGMAGSAVLIVLTMQNLQSVTSGVAYIALFGIGSMLGMVVLSASIAWPLWRWGQPLTWLNNAARASVGTLTIVLGSIIVYKHWMII